jgi:hypothetical protein
MNPHFQLILAALSAEKVEFLVVGAYSLGAHGLVRATGDIDILVRPSRENAERVWRGLLRFGAPLSSMPVEDFVKPDNIYRMGRPPNRIDIMTSITGVDFDAAWSNRLEADVEGVKVFVLSARDQVTNKRASGRPKDSIDADWLERHRLSSGDEPRK